MAIRVGRWDCQQCGQIGVLGPETKCNRCGAPRPKNVRFYLPNDASIIHNEEEVKKAKSGADWLCSFCGNNNKAVLNNCSSCGNSRTSSDDKNLATREYSLKEVPRSGEIPREKKPASDYKPNYSGNTEASKKASRWIFAILGGFILVFIVLMVLASMKHTIKVEVTEMRWERDIHTERYVEVVEEDWVIPSGGRTITSFRAIHHHRRVSDGYRTRTRNVQVKVGEEKYVCGQRDMGNGYFEDKYCNRPIYENRTESYQEEVFHEEPVYQTKYRYAIFRWKPDAPISKSGRDKDPGWGDVSELKSNPNYRETRRTETYEVILRDDKNELHTEALSFTRWQQISVGDKLEAKRNGLGQYLGLTHQ